MKIPYGQRFLEVDIPEGNYVDIFKPEKTGIGEALDLKEPIIAAVRGKREKIRESRGRICIIVSDKTRLALTMLFYRFS